MKENALSLANYFIDLAQKDGSIIKQLGLMKRVYIAYGFCLALLDRSVIDPRFDTVEAWKYGPVIPSVYHSFKHFRNNPITEKTVVMNWNEAQNNYTFDEPNVVDPDIKKILNFVWDRYKTYSESDLVTLTHKTGTPWEVVYIEGMNRIIPEEYVTIYYKRLIASLQNTI